MIISKVGYNAISKCDIANIAHAFIAEFGDEFLIYSSIHIYDAFHQPYILEMYSRVNKPQSSPQIVLANIVDNKLIVYSPLIFLYPNKVFIKNADDTVIKYDYMDDFINPVRLEADKRIIYNIDLVGEYYLLTVP